MLDKHLLSCFVNRPMGVALILVLVFPSITLAGFLNLDSWQLDTGVQSTGFPQDTEDITLVQNPFVGISDTSIGLNTNHTAYDFRWSDLLGTFHIDVDHHIESTKTNTVSDGRIFITPLTDITLTIDGSLNYSSSPSDLAFIRFPMRVYDVTHDTNLYSELKRGGSLVLEPASGTLTHSGSFTLLAGNQYQLSYAVLADFINEPTPIAPIDTEGYVHMMLTPVPEPTSLLLGAGILLSRRRFQKRFN